MRTDDRVLDGWIGEKIGVCPPTLPDIRAFQLMRLRQVLRYAAERAPFYRTLYGKTPDVRSFEDFCNLPVISADDLIENGRKMLCVPQEDAVRVFTSGTTSAPKRLYFTQRELNATVDYFACGSRQFIEAGEKALLLFPCLAENGAAQLFMKALSRLGATGVPFGVPKDMAEACRALRTERPQLVLAMPQAAKDLRRCGGEAGRFSTLLISGDAMDESEIAKQRERFGCDVFLQYGLTETAFGLGVDCRAFSGYHLREADYYVEILDEKNNSPPRGEYGRVVVTSLHCGAMPLIRYDTGDVSRYLAESCACGSVLPLLDRVRPRGVLKGYRVAGT